MGIHTLKRCCRLAGTGLLAKGMLPERASARDDKIPAVATSWCKREGISRVLIGSRRVGVNPRQPHHTSWKPNNDAASKPDKGL